MEPEAWWKQYLSLVEEIFGPLMKECGLSFVEKEAVVGGMWCRVVYQDENRIAVIECEPIVGGFFTCLYDDDHGLIRRTDGSLGYYNTKGVRIENQSDPEFADWANMGVHRDEVSRNYREELIKRERKMRALMKQLGWIE